MLEQCIILGMLAWLSREDLKTQNLSCRCLLLCAVMGIGIYVWQRPFSWLYLLGGVMIGVGLLLCSLLSHESIGRGDGYLFCVTGIYLGFWNNLFLLVVASVLSGISALILLIAKRCAKTAQIPFVPFVLAAYLILLLGGSL